MHMSPFEVIVILLLVAIWTSMPAGRRAVGACRDSLNRHPLLLGIGWLVLMLWAFW